MGSGEEEERSNKLKSHPKGEKKRGSVVETGQPVW